MDGLITYKNMFVMKMKLSGLLLQSKLKFYQAEA